VSIAPKKTIPERLQPPRANDLSSPEVEILLNVLDSKLVQRSCASNLKLEILKQRKLNRNEMFDVDIYKEIYVRLPVNVKKADGSTSPSGEGA
jgi:hypothetical protein